MGQNTFQKYKMTNFPLILDDIGNKKEGYEQNLAFILLGYLIGDIIAVPLTRRKKRKNKVWQN